VCCLFYFQLHSTFFEGKEGWDLWWVLLVCIKWAFQKNGCFLVVPDYINPEDNYGPLIDFLNQISKLSYFNVLGLADFVMYH